MARKSQAVLFDLAERWRVMNRQRFLFGVVMLIAVSLLAGCHRDPNVRKQKYLESGKRYSAQSKYKEAAIQFSNAIKIDKNFPDAHYELAQAYEHLGQFSAAYAELTRTVALQPANMKARIDLGNLLLAGGRIEDAVAQANAVMAAQPRNGDVHALLSSIAARRGQKDQALAQIQQAIELDPNRAAFHEQLALLQVGDATKLSTVEEELKKAVALDSKSANPRLLLSAFYAKNGRWQEAEEVSRDAVASDSKSIPARQNLAGIFLQQSNQAKAEEVLRQASADLADDPQGTRILADYYMRSGQLDKAKAEFARLSAKYSKQLPIQKAYVRVLLQARDYAPARTVIAGLMKKNAKDPEVAALNGIVLLNDDKAGDSVIALQEAARNFPKDAFIQYWLGKAALVKSDASLAERSFRRAAELNPSALDAQQELVRIAGQRGDLNLMYEVANKTIAAAPRSPIAYVWRATVEMNRNAADKAETDLKTAMVVAPQNPLAYIQLGKLRFSQKRFSEGVAFLEKALEYDPNSIEALRLLVGYDLFAKQPAKAMERLGAQISKWPNNSGFYDLLAQLQIQNKNLDQAAAAAQKAMQLNPGDGEAVMLFAEVQIRRGQTANAIGAWEQWSKTRPNDAGAYALLGTLEEARGDRQKAKAYYNKSLQIQSQQRIAPNNLAYLMLQNGENADVALTMAQTARRGMPDSPSTADTLAWAYYFKGTYGFARDLLEDAVKAK